ncbi:unnamed protein product [Oppiella nova]|uniref:BTB domain-containing protein n=1 Tax=Oppiella nova TaxID=334625 RepID=A0A7R9M699_9ACAR|nr:unnamed protein product [Oppiella nova]CAG2171457.1 unnamed protein product [Oppiella nova]
MGLGSLEGVRAAIEQISLRTHGGHSTSTYSSNYSGSEYEPTFRRLIRHSSLETIGTNITSAGDDFVWVDTHSRLVELQHIPWDTRDVLTVIQEGRLQHQLSRISMDCVPRLSYLLQRPLVRIAVEAQRLAKPLGLCTKHEVCGAVRVLLSAQLADTCVKSGHRAAAIFAVSGGPDTFRQSKSGRAGLQLSVGRFHRWMCDTRMGQYVDEYSAIYMTGAMENLLEEIILHCLSITGADCILTASLLDTCVANNTDFWGVLQPFAHLIAGRTANGVLSLPPGLQITGTGSASVESTGSTDGSKTSAIKGLEQKLLTTCVGSVQQLDEIISSVSQYRVSNPQTVYRRNGHNWWSTHHWSMASLHSLYYYMRCAQLEHNQCAPVADPTGQTPLSQELVYERPFLVLPPLYEWMRVCAAHAYYRRCPVIDKDDVLQAARLLLPGIDCPVRPLTPTTSEEWLYFRPDLDASECLRRLKVELAFRMLSCGRPDVLTHALQLLPHNTGINTVDDSGLTALMRACIAGDIRLVRVLCDANCDVNVETPAPPTHKNRERYGSNGHVMAETQHWTALCYACIHGHREIVNILLDMGANVEGGYRYGEEMATQTPLQLAASAGRIDIVKVLLTYGADPYLTTTVNDSAVAHCSASRGSSSAIALAAMHGQQLVLRALVVQPTYGHNSSSHKDVLSLEEMLAEGRNSSVDSRRPRIQVVATNQSQSSLNTSDGGTPGAGGHSPEGSSSGSNQKVIQLTKPKLRALQEAMYHSAEGGCLEITLDLRNIGIPWTMHTWMQTVGTTHAMRLDAITSQLLQDFTHLWCDDCSTHFIDQCLPLLFTIFRHQKHNTGTALLLADIISTCYGRQAVKCRPLSASFANGSDVRVGARIDAKYVNNKDMSDCVFKVENRLFFAHKIILVNASKRFHNMLTTGAHQTTGAPDGGNGSPPQQSAPIVVNDIRFDIFQKVMQFLYNGGFDTDSDVDQNDILELMSAAAYFQLDGLLRYCSRRCCDCVSEDSVVSLYMNAIQYNALELMQFCQKYMLENLVPLLERDPQISQLLFQGSSKVNITNKPDHLSALLFTLQQRCRDRQQQVLQKQQQNGAKNQFSR